MVRRRVLVENLQGWLFAGPWFVGLVALLLVPDIALRRVGPGALERVATLVRRGLRRKEVP